MLVPLPIASECEYTRNPSAVIFKGNVFTNGDDKGPVDVRDRIDVGKGSLRIVGWDRQCDVDEPDIIRVTYGASIASVLDKSKMWVLAVFTKYVKSLVTSQGIAVKEIDVSGYCDPDDGETQVVVTVHTDELVDIAMQAWRGVDICIEKWLNDQSESVRTTILEQFTTDFTWKPAAIAI